MYFLRVAICSIFTSILVIFLLSICDIEIKENTTINFILLGCMFLSWCVVDIVDKFKKSHTTQEEKEPIEKEPIEKEPKKKKKKKKKKKENEIICVTEIQGKRKIIKDGVVIFEEEIKGTDLKGVRQITDDNE